MSELQQAIASGQVSAAQIEAHHAAGDLPIVMFEPRFQHTYCSQCLKDCGPGMDGVAGCADHIADASKMVATPQVQLLATKHTGMRVDYRGLFKQSRAALRNEPALAEMLRQFQDHLTELGERWYSGDVAVVDEILQLYCVESDARAAIAAIKAAS